MPMVGMGLVVQPAAAGGSIVHEQTVNVYAQGSGASSTGTNVTVGSTTNTLAIVILNIFGQSRTDTKGASAVRLGGSGGELLTQQVLHVDNTANRMWTEIWTLHNPTSGSRELWVTLNSTCRERRIDYMELSGVDATNPVTTTDGGGDTTDQTATAAGDISITTSNNGAFIVSGVAVESNGGNTISGTGGVTIGVQGDTDAASVDNVRSASGYEEIVTAGADGHGYSWSTAKEYSCAAIEVKPA